MTEAQINPARKNQPVTKQLSWEEKADFCKRWKESGLKRNVFCKQHGLALGTFYGWCSKLWPDTHKKRRSRLSPVRIIDHTTKKQEDNLFLLELSLPNQSMARMKLPISTVGKIIQELLYATTIIR